MEKSRRILVLDSSRVVRATLRKHLKEDFDVVEEANGEAAWQTLMLDAQIVGVISGVHPLKLEAHDLLDRLHASSIRRLRELPFVLVVSDVDNAVERDADRARGVTGFLTKTMNKAAMVHALEGHLGLRAGGRAAPAPSTPEPMAYALADSYPGIVMAVNQDASDHEDGKRGVDKAPDKAGQLLSHEDFSLLLSSLELGRTPTAVLLFRIDNFPALIEQFGADVTVKIANRFAKLLQSKVGSGDVIGHYASDRLAIVSRAVDRLQAERFGQRVCKSLAAGQITIRGAKVKLTASVGVASTSDDFVGDGGALCALAAQRLNRTPTADVAAPPDLEEGQHGRLLAALGAPADADLRSRIGSLGLQIMPLLRVLDAELALGLALTEIEQQLRQRARREEATV